MPLTTRVLNNTGSPLVDSSGTVLAGTTITFQLVDVYDHPTDAWDAISGERVVPVKESVVTDASGLFTISLWPNDRGTESTMYLCIVKAKGVQSFKGAIATSASALSWIDFKAQGVPLTPSQLDQLAILNGLTVSATELNYTSGVTSLIQTQLDAKADSLETTASLAEKVSSLIMTGPTTGGEVFNDGNNVRLSVGGAGGNATVSMNNVGEVSITTTGTIGLVGDKILSGGYTLLGDGAGNNTTIEPDGTLQMNGTATTWRDINISLVPPAGQASALPAIIAVNADPYLSCYAFSGTNSTPDQISGSLEIDHSYKEGSDISFHVHWAPTTTAIGNVVWQLRYAWFNRDTTPVGATLQTNLVATTTGVAWQEQTASFTLTGTGKTMGSRLMFTLFRDPINAGDTYAANAATYDMGLHFESDTLGSREMLVK